MLHRLGDFEVFSQGGTRGNGVGVVATCDSANDSIQVLVYNHFASTTLSSDSVDDVSLTVKNIPWLPGR